MENYKKASSLGMDLIIIYLKKRMKDIGISQKKLSEIIEVTPDTISRYFNKKTAMPLPVYLEICGALDLMPFLKTREDNETEINNRIFFD